MSFWDELQQASFRGVPFAVRGGSSLFGRRTTVHQYPNREKPFPEDMGRSAGEYRIAGFLVEDSLVYGGGSVIAQRNAMKAAVEAPGPAILVHPTYGQLKVSVLDRSAEFVERMDRGRYFEFNLTVVEWADRIFPTSAQASTSLLSNLADALDLGAAADFVKSMTQTINLGLGVVKGVISLGRAVVGQVVSCAAGFAVLVGQASRDATSLANMACLLGAVVGQSYGRYTNANVTSAYIASRANSGISALTLPTLETQAAAARQSVNVATSAFTAAANATDASSVGNFPVAAQAVTSALASAIINPGDAVRLFNTLAAYAPAAPGGTGQTVAAQGVAQAAVSAMLRRAAIGAMARAIAAYSPTSYNDAANVQTDVTAAIDSEILVAGDAGDDNTYQALRDLRQAVVATLQAAGANLARLQTFAFGATLPALVLANRLYQDASREGQLVAQANPVHPAFMPTTFQALAQ